MKRRDFIKGVGAGSLLAGSAMAPGLASAAKAEYKWKMVTTWPKNFPGLGTGANYLARLIGEMSGSAQKRNEDYEGSAFNVQRISGADRNGNEF